MLLQIDLLGLDVEKLHWYQMSTRALIVFGVAMALIRSTGMQKHT